nr:MDIS1-interacting receptor like kinase 2-like [Ipomoea batatas]
MSILVVVNHLQLEVGIDCILLKHYKLELLPAYGLPRKHGSVYRPTKPMVRIVAVKKVHTLGWQDDERLDLRKFCSNEIKHINKDQGFDCPDSSNWRLHLLELWIYSSRVCFNTAMVGPLAEHCSLIRHIEPSDCTCFIYKGKMATLMIKWSLESGCRYFLSLERATFCSFLAIVICGPCMDENTREQQTRFTQDVSHMELDGKMTYESILEAT